jgi:hypothetical protein
MHKKNYFSVKKMIVLKKYIKKKHKSEEVIYLNPFKDWLVSGLYFNFLKFFFVSIYLLLEKHNNAW